MLMLSVPLSIRPVRMRPRKLSRSSKVTSILNGPVGIEPRAPAHGSTIVSNSGVRSPSRTSSVEPGIAGAARGVERREIELLVIGVEGQEQLEHLVEHFGGRASGRSILLTTTIGRRPSASALPVTNLVCGIGPSAASTSRITPSTIDRMRSTSAPKSAWPGVSTMLMCVPFATRPRCTWRES